jgi:hypothetical protein
MKKSHIYIYDGPAEFKLEGKSGFLLDYNIQDCYTEQVINKGANSLIRLRITKGTLKSKHLLSKLWAIDDVSGKILCVKEHHISFDYMNSQKIELDIPFYSWELNRFTVEFNENKDIINIELDESVLLNLFNQGFKDSLINKPMKKLHGPLMKAYSIGYNICKKTDGLEVDGLPMIRKMINK